MFGIFTNVPFRGMEVLHQENWTTEVSSSLKRFEKQLIIALKEEGWDGKEDEGTVTWTFAGALFYCITVITTIGKTDFSSPHSISRNVKVTATSPRRLPLERS